MIMAGGFHLFPFRTQKLSLHAPMVLPGVPVGEWVVAGMIVALEKTLRHIPRGLPADSPLRKLDSSWLRSWVVLEEPDCVDISWPREFNLFPCPFIYRKSC